MLQGMMARKIGMTQIFEDDGRVIPVTVLEAGPVTVVQKKTMEKDGCDQVQVGYEAIEERKVNYQMGTSGDQTKDTVHGIVRSAYRGKLFAFGNSTRLMQFRETNDVIIID